MSLVQALVLGVVQGATEFLPISSSGHLVLVPWFLGWTFESRSAFIFDVLVQWGTILAVLLYFRRDLFAIGLAWLRGLAAGQPFADPHARLGWLLLLASLPAALIGLTLKSTVERTFAQPAAVSAFLLLTATLLILSERVSTRQRLIESLNWRDGLFIGLAQALALFPGVSRSGSTIAGGLTRGLERAAAARFSFLLAVPTMIGAGLIALLDLRNATDASAQLGPLLVGFFAAAVVGFAAIHFLLEYLRKHPLTVFAIYCLLLGIAGLVRYAFSA
ncbi:MAG: undecaprenyl-diphosphatase UppP [Anaerolineales bacterium]